MNLPSPGAVTLFSRKSPLRLSHYFPKEIYTHGKICAPHKPTSVLLYFFLHLFQFPKPSRRSTNCCHARARQFPQILCRCLRRRKLHGRIHSPHRVRRQAPSTCILSTRDSRPHFKAILRSEPLNHRSHLPAPDNRQSPRHTAP